MAIENLGSYHAFKFKLHTVMCSILSKETSSCGHVWVLLQMLRVLTRGESLVPISISQVIVILGR